MDGKLKTQKKGRSQKGQKQEKLVSVISTAIGNTIRYSLDQEFRQKCFDLLEVNNTVDCQEAVKEKLLSLTKTSFPTVSQNSKELMDVNRGSITSERNIGNDNCANYETLFHQQDNFFSFNKLGNNPENCIEKIEIQPDKVIHIQNSEPTEKKNASFSIGGSRLETSSVILDKSCFEWNDTVEVVHF